MRGVLGVALTMIGRLHAIPPSTTGQRDAVVSGPAEARVLPDRVQVPVGTVDRDVERDVRGSDGASSFIAVVGPVLARCRLPRPRASGPSGHLGDATGLFHVPPLFVERRKESVKSNCEPPSLLRKLWMALKKLRTSPWGRTTIWLPMVWSLADVARIWRAGSHVSPPSVAQRRYIKGFDVVDEPTAFDLDGGREMVSRSDMCSAFAPMRSRKFCNTLFLKLRRSDLRNRRTRR